jgi:hypothetical protein
VFLEEKNVRSALERIQRGGGHTAELPCVSFHVDCQKLRSIDNSLRS